MTKINIEEIMEEIRQEIRDKGISGDLLDFSDPSLGGFTVPLFNPQEMLMDLQAVHGNYYVDPVRPLGDGLKGKIKKALRKSVLFYIKPMVEDQNLYNINVLDTLKQMYAYVCAQETYKKRMDRMLERILKENEELREQIEQLKKQQ